MFHGGVSYSTSLLAFSPVVCAACNTSIHASNSSAMGDAPEQRLFDIDLWFVGGVHFVIRFASFQVPYRMSWRQDLQKLMPFNRKLLWVQSGFAFLTIITFGTLRLALHTALLRGDRAALGLTCFIGIYYHADSCGCDLFFAHRLAQGNGICRGTRSPNLSLLVARGELCWAIRLARMAEGEWLIRISRWSADNPLRIKRNDRPW